MVSCVTPGNIENVVTELRYGPGGQLLELIARNPVTGDQVTRYEYGVTLAESGIASNDLLRAEIYPDATGSSDRVSYSYNRQGQRTRLTDQNGSVHEYEYDLLGRQTADKVTTLDAGVDGAVRRIGQSYEVRGLVEKVTSYSDAAGTAPVNEVQNVYNSFGQFQEQYQEHSGSVNTGTTPKVAYSYADGSANTTRPTSVTYPNGRVLEYLYDDTAADKLSRIHTLRWDGTDVCRYSYLGLSAFVTTDYLQPQVKLDYALGSGANPYAGFDRFGRIIDLLWAKYGASGSSSSSSSGGAGEDLVHLKYGYDRASSRTHREDLVAQGYGKDFDELYGYDGLHRLKKFHRGRLTDDNQAITSPTFQQGWQLDATGNWQNFTQNDQADPDQTLDQQRLANRVNEITQIARTVGADWATPEYDRNGNMTVIPQPKEMTQTFQGTWDAWNRLVKLTEPNGSGGWQTLAEYQYDGQTWRIVAKSYASGVLDETRHFYFTNRWQDIEERLGSTPSSAAANRQFVWGERYIDDLVLRDRDASGGTLDERLYALQDALFSVVALVDSNGNDIVERFAYRAYGQSQPITGAFLEQSESSCNWECRFTGRYFDFDTAIYYYRARYFDSKLGRFVSRDPIAYAGGSINTYEYVHGKPGHLADWSGLQIIVLLPEPWDPNWEREDWEEWIKKGGVPPGHGEDERPEDYPKGPLPLGTPPDPIAWGEEIGDETHYPSEEEMDDRKGDCVCSDPTKKESRMRPRGINGDYPRPGLGIVKCEVGKKVTMRYKGRCVPKDSPPFPKDCGKCESQTCNRFIVWVCKEEKVTGRNPFGTSWVVHLGFRKTKCK
jgi:RHS repeat-associated protein